MEDSSQAQHWNKFAQQWNKLSSPMRPCAEDVEIMRRKLGSDPGRTLLLGVTPELAGHSNNLIALDNNAAMISALWSGDEEGHHAVLGDWLDMPFESQYFDTVIGDGSTVLLSYSNQYEQMFRQIGRVIKPGGKVSIRFFLRPAKGETCEQVCNEALSGRIKRFHAFKWRLSMAVAAEGGSPDMNVSDTFAAFTRLLPDRNRLAEATGWAMEEIATIDLYHGSAARYSYPTLSELRQKIPPEFVEDSIECGTYELAECCPTMTFVYLP